MFVPCAHKCLYFGVFCCSRVPTNPVCTAAGTWHSCDATNVVFLVLYTGFFQAIALKRFAAFYFSKVLHFKSFIFQ